MKDLQSSDARALMSNHFYPSNSILEETYIGELHECKGCNRTYRGECCKHCYKTLEARDEAYKLRLSLQRLNEENEIKRIKKRVKEEAIERLKTLQGGIMIKSESILKLMPALIKAQSEMEAATKSANNPYFKSKYADLNSVIGVSIPVLNKHNVAVLQPTVVIDSKKYVQTMLIHESGEYMGCLTEILCFKENDAQQQGSGITYARRYGLQSLLSIGAEDDDGNTATEKHLGQKPPVENKTENKPALSQEKPKSVKTTTFSLPSPEREKDLKYIKDALSAFPKETRKEMSKQLTGVDSWEEVLFLPDESIKDICKLITLKYAQE